MSSCKIQWIAFGGNVELRKGHKEETTKCGAKESAIDRLEATIWGGINVQARGAEKLHGFLSRNIITPNWKHMGLVAENARTGTEMFGIVFVRHLLDSRSRGYIALVYESVEKFRRAFYDRKIIGKA